MINKFPPENKGITTLRIYQYWVFYNRVIETCFDMLKSSEHKKICRYLNYKSPNFYDCSEVRSAHPPISFYYNVLRIGGTEFPQPAIGFSETLLILQKIY